MPIVEDTSRAELQATPEGVAQFRAMGLGLTVHWGLPAVMALGGWMRYHRRIPVHEYEKLAEQFKPTRFDAEAWTALVAEIGARAFLITTKHHDGFCMYDTALTEYKVTNTPFGRDPIAELAKACRRRGIQLYFYYSLLDCHHPGYRTNWPAYVEYYQGQVRELCTRYGELGGIVFDGYWPRAEFAPDREYFRAGGAWDLAGTYDLIHALQPKAMVANNHHVLPLKGEDYQVFEQDFPGENAAGFNTTEVGDLPLAAWFIVNHRGWYYFQGEQEVKPADQLAEYVLGSAKHKAICWLNVGPTPDGDILAEEAEALRSMSSLLRRRGASIPTDD